MKLKRRAMHIQTLLSLSIALVSLVAVFLIGILTTLFYTGSSKENALISTREIVTQVNNNLSYYISDIMNVADYARNIARSTGDLTIKDIRDQLEILKASRNDLTRIAVFDMNGNNIVSTNPAVTESSVNIKESEWFRKAIDGEGNFYFTGPHNMSLSRTERDWVVTYSSVINFRDNGMTTPEKGVLLINLNFKALSEIARNAYLPSSGYVYIVTNNGELVYHPREDEIRNGTFAEDFQGVDEHVFGSYISTFQEKERITIVEPITQTSWRIVGVGFMDDIMTTQRDFIISLAVALTALAIITIIISQFIARYIASPIKQLELAMRQVQKGNFDVIAPMEGTKEVQSLSSSFAIMIAKIRKLMDDIKHVEAIKRQHELDALQAKINPHFLYNTLDSMIWMAETGDKDGVIKMTTALASLFRISIAKGHDTITIKEELYHTKSYLEIQQMRYKDKFTFSIDIPEDLENCPTIKLIVQPIVENSIYHGIKLLQEEGKIDIAVKAIDNNKLTITITDNGVGMNQKLASSLLDPSVKHENKSDGNGIGLINVEERIKLTYGNEFGLDITSELDVGTKVVITLPRLPAIRAVVIHS